MLPLPLLLACLPVAQALSWAYAPAARKSSAMESKSNHGYEPTPAELAAILDASSTMDAYAKKPDCFRRAMVLVQARCSELETNEAERVKAALSMTLCEIATAEDHSPPMECTHFQSERASNGDDSPGRCVSALSRSAQYWSSYSGYLREVSQLCFAFRRWNDIDTAREVHRNATVETIAVLRYMSDREKRMQASWEESNAVLGSLRAVLDRLHASTSAIDIASSAVTDKLSLALSEMAGAYKVTMLEFHEREGRRQAEKLSEIDITISTALDQLATATASITPAVERLLVQQFESAFSSLKWQLEGIAALAEQTGTQLVLFERTFGELEHVAATLVSDVRHSSADMENHLRTSHMLQEKQLEVAQAADDVSLALSELVGKAQEGMQELNGTISEVKDSLRDIHHHDWAATLWIWFQGTTLHLLRIHPGQPLFQALDGFIRVLRVLVALASSSLMSVVVLLASVRNLFPTDRRPIEPQVRMYNSISAASTGTARARMKISGFATETSSSDLAVQAPAPAWLLPDSNSERLSDSTTFRRRPRISRIPDRLCRSLR